MCAIPRLPHSAPGTRQPGLELRGELLCNEPMSRHVSWRAGGSVERCYIPADIEDLALFLKTGAGNGPIYFVGLGSNLLVRDGGLKGTVILLHGALKRIELSREGLIYAEAGVGSPKVASFAAQNNFEGAEFLAGIPGTVGGALAMNAGCHGSETWQCVTRTLTIDRHGELHERFPEDFEIGYRHVALRVMGNGEGVMGRNSDNSSAHHPSPIPHHQQEWFVAAWFRFTPGDGKAARARIKELLAKRLASQPLTQPNAGSVFRNPPGDYAARLIEASGLKGLRIGGAQVSEKHANFIVNLGNATATDIETLIETVQATVKSKHGIELVREVRILGEE